MRAHATTVCLAALGAAFASGCGGGTASNRPQGEESFVAQSPRVGGAGGTSLTPTGGATAGGTAATPDASGASTARTVEESDLYQLSPDGSTLYVLNGYRGLMVVDLRDLDHPRLLARVPAVGAPRDLYLHGSVLYFTVGDTLVWAWAAGDGSVQPTPGSQVWTVDVRDPAAPEVLSRLDVEGSAVDSRVVGDVLYVFSRRYGWWDVAPAGGGGAVGGVATSGSDGATSAGGAAASSDAYYLTSFDLRDPRRPAAVATRAFEASGWGAHAHFTAERVTVAQSGFDAAALRERTRFSAFDISDAAGAIADGATFDAPGTVVDRWAMDFDPATGLFRSALGDGWNAGATVRIWSSPAPGAATPLGAASVGAGESLTAARFDGHRAYVVTARSVDPLFVVDTADPSRPAVSTQPLHMPGQLDFIEPRGDRLVALGRTNESGTWQLAASLLDVAELDRPVLLARALFGDGAQWVNASRDDMRKAFQVLDAAGLVAVPFQGWDPRTYAWGGGVQLLSIDLAAGQLQRRGFLPHAGDVTRAFLLPRGTRQLCALSDQRLQLVDAASLDAPRERAALDLARPVVDLVFTGGRAVELAGDWWRGDAELVVTEADDPDAAVPLARVPVPAPQVRAFLVGTAVWLLAADWRDGSYRAWLQAADLADPVHPRLAGRIDVPAGMGAAAVGGVSWGWGDEAVLLGSTLALHRQPWPAILAGGTGAGGGTAGAAPAGSGGAAAAGGDAPADSVLLLDLSSPDAPRVAGEVKLPANGWSWGLTASGGALWITHFTPSGDGAQGRFFLDRIDLATAGGPAVTSVNVPGVFVAAATGGQRVYALETVWPEATSSGQASPRSYLHALDLTARGTARLAATLPLEGAPWGAVRDGDRLYLALATWAPNATATDLAAIDLARLRLGSRQSVGAWASPLGAAGGKLFLSGWYRSRTTLFVYGLADPDRPAFETSAPAPGWPATVQVREGRAYLPCGPYGVLVVPLAP